MIVRRKCKGEVDLQRKEKGEVVMKFALIVVINQLIGRLGEEMGRRRESLKGGKGIDSM